MKSWLNADSEINLPSRAQTGQRPGNNVIQSGVNAFHSSSNSEDEHNDPVEADLKRHTDQSTSTHTRVPVNQVTTSARAIPSVLHTDPIRPVISKSSDDINEFSDDDDDDDDDALNVTKARAQRAVSTTHVPREFYRDGCAFVMQDGNRCPNSTDLAVPFCSSCLAIILHLRFSESKKCLTAFDPTAKIMGKLVSSHPIFRKGANIGTLFNKAIDEVIMKRRFGKQLTKNIENGIVYDALCQQLLFDHYIRKTPNEHEANVIFVDGGDDVLRIIATSNIYQGEPFIYYSNRMNEKRASSTKRRGILKSSTPSKRNSSMVSSHCSSGQKKHRHSSKK